MDLVERLNKRYAVKRMTGEKLPQEKVDRILEAIRLSASSLGLQPYTVYVIENLELRKQIQTVANNQQQIVGSSHLLVFAAWDHYSSADVNAFIQNVSTARGTPLTELQGFKKMINAAVAQPANALFAWHARQTYIALGFGLVAAAVEGVDATPMEGFNATALDEVLHLKEKGLRSVALLALGKRDEANDYLVHAKKVRRAKEQLFVHLN
jgi:nitroreductase / dihydropteridine reductase